MVDADLMIRQFRLEKPVTFKESADRTAVRAMPDRTVVVFVRERLEKDLPDLLARAKLGETDPLLVTFLCQADAAEEETRCFKEFIRLCAPVLGAWTFKAMRRWVPGLYRQKIQKVREVLDRACERGVKVTARTLPALLGLLAILYENQEDEASFRLEDDPSLAPLAPYMEWIRNAVRSEPDVRHYLALAAGAPYTVTPETAPDGVSYYRVKCR
jgi:hypothetical protein